MDELVVLLLEFCRATHIDSPIEWSDDYEIRQIIFVIFIFAILSMIYEP
jgi:hypothetical protein